MKAWDTATVSLRCSYDAKHSIKVGDRMFVIQGATWRKVYCPSCAAARQAAPADSGEVLEVQDAPSYPTPLKQMADIAATAIADRFDAKAAAAGRDADPLFDEPFEEAQS